MAARHPHGEPSDLIRSVSRALRVLEAVGQTPRGLTVKQIARRCELARRLAMARRSCRRRLGSCPHHACAPGARMLDFAESILLYKLGDQIRARRVQGRIGDILDENPLLAGALALSQGMLMRARATAA